MDEQKLEDKIRRSAEKLPVPDSLEPEQIRQKLDAQKKVTFFGRLTRKGSAWQKYGVRAAEVAAAVVIVFAVGHRFGAESMRRTFLPENKTVLADAQQGSTDTEAEMLQSAAQTETQTVDTAAPRVMTAAPEAKDAGSALQTAENAAAAQSKEQTADAAPQTVENAAAAQGREQTENAAAAQGKEQAADAAPQTAENTAAAQGKEQAADAAPQTAENAAAAQGKEQAAAHEEGFAPIGDEDALFDRLVLLQNLRNVGDFLYSTTSKDMMEYEEIAVDSVQDAAGAAPLTNMVAVESEAGASDTGPLDYSQTNLREMGVDEGDLVKTDGRYIYVIKNNNSVKIISAAGSELELIASLQPELLNESVRDLYVTGDMVNLVTSGTRSNMVESEQDVYRTETYNYCKVLTYDIADRSAPKLAGSLEQEGYYQGSRKVGEYLYLFTNYQPQIALTKEESTIMPLINGAAINADDVYVPDSLENSNYLVISSMNVNEPEKTIAHKAVVSGAHSFYVSASSIFICNSDWVNSKDVTNILKFGYEDGDIWGVGVTNVDGYLNDTFSLDEYNGHLRVVATDWNSGDEINALYVFDENMQMTGKITDIAPGETIRSARFLGDTGYFVTFRQTDPLFSVDLSDPADPKILGELKISGFSSYLHFYGKDRLLGIGYEADEETGRSTGVKLSMFDISDPANVTEIKKYVIDGAGYLPGDSNYKAIMINPDKNLFGFVCDGNYLVFTYEEQEGFVNLLTYNMAQGNEQSSYWYAYDDVRGLYIADTFYLVCGDIIRAFDMTKEFVQGGMLEL